MNIGVAIVSTRKWKLASFSRSVLIFGVSSARFVALMNIENPCYSRRSSKTKGGGLGPQQRHLSASGRCSSCDLVEGRIGNVIGFYLRSSVNHFRQGLRHFGVSSAVVAFRVFGLVPQTDAKCFLSSRCDKCDFVPESLLFSKQGKDFPFQSLGELGNAALQMHGDFARKHIKPPSHSAPLRAVVGNHPVFRWFASLHLFTYVRWAHHTSQGLVLSQCSKQQHYYSEEMFKFDHHR